ncbi:hypothetical protein EBB07_16065 [Paenibacillaceae bacterium]|nr:hypothetical protein EBB07_16065 [Paenibacillaceae bacterium]
MTRLLQREREVKLELIASIARGQNALARVLESVADLSEQSPALTKSIREQVRLLTGIQLTMAEMLTGTRLRNYRLGKPGKVWLADGVRASRASTVRGRHEFSREA